MIISLNWLKKFTKIDMPIDELATLIGSRLVEIEEINYIGKKYQDVVVVKAVDVKNLPDSDHLNIVKIDDGGLNVDLERDENGLIQVVCGAPNIKSGMLVAWLPPNSIVPETFGTDKEFTLGSRELRGYMSNGMIASARELDLYDEHEGILEIDVEVKPGTKLSEVYELDDYLIDIENKSLTHRPDCFGVIGFAREVAAISGNKFETPDFMNDFALDNYVAKFPLELKVSIDDKELSEGYCAVVLDGSDGSKKSPILIQTYLSRVGVRPISAIVDVTNYLMLMTGQPLHAFDYDKVIALNNDKAEIHVRAGINGEKLELLDGREIKLSADDIVISSGKTAIGLAGAMGGSNTVIDEKTKRIIIESATFNLYKLRTTQMRHGIFSEAITRFTKGQPAELSLPVLNRAISLTGEWASSSVVSKIAVAESDEKKLDPISITVSQINSVLGSNFSQKDIIKTLENVEFVTTTNSLNADEIDVVVPYWRSDIHINEDIIEEIGRINGFDFINPTLPGRNFEAVKPSEFDEFRKTIRKVLTRSGANEVLTYSFIHSDVLAKSGQDKDNSYKIVNSISPELQHYRQSLTPSVLGLVYGNVRQGYDKFALYEINKTHKKEDGLDEDLVPVENYSLAYVITNKDKQSSATYYDAKKTLDYLCANLHLTAQYRIIEDSENTDCVYSPFEIKRSAAVYIGDEKVGIVGEYKKSTMRNFKLSESTAGFEIDIKKMFEQASNKVGNYKPISRFPSSSRDICFRVSLDTNYADIVKPADEVLSALDFEYDLSPVDIYKKDGDDKKNITIRIKLNSFDHTLTNDEVNAVADKVSQKVVDCTKATII